MIDGETFDIYLQKLIGGETASCEQIVARLLDQQVPLLVLYEELFRRSLYQIGRLWEQNRVSVAVEHLSTAITERMLATVYPRAVAGRRFTGRRAIVSCGSNEYHQVGARMVADVMELEGWDVRFLGANIPERALLQMIDQARPELVGLSLAMYFNIASFTRLVESVRHHYPTLQIIAGGQAFRWGGSEPLSRSCKVEHVSDLETLAREVAA